MSDTSAVVNPQIVDAVEKSTEYAFGYHDYPGTTDASKRVSAGAAVAFDKAAQAVALGFQDSVDYQRNIMAISTAAQGKALAAAFAATDVPTTIKFIGIYLAAMLAPLASGLTAEVTEKVNTSNLQNFPRG